MPPRRRVNVVWFKCTDLRTHDHAALKAAHAQNLPVLHLYVFDPFWHANKTRICGYPKTGAVRTRFQLEAIADLASRLDSLGHKLCTRTGISTAKCFEEICDDYIIANVFAFQEICSEELRVERQVRETLRKKGQGTLNLFWGFELHHRDDLTFDPARPRGAFNSYTSFRKRVEESKIRPSSREDPRFLEKDLSICWDRADAALPSVQECMGSTYVAAMDPGEEKDPRAEMRWQGGETAALARIRQYFWEDDCLGNDYVGATMTMDPSKSCMRDKAMSKLSPWLAHGCLSPRFLYDEVKRYERERKKTKSTYWITHELVWRDFVRFGSIHAGTSIFKIGGPQNSHPMGWSWSTDKNWFTAWVDGQTGFPFVDCFMRELKTTGYCNHMGRECAGWFLVGDLGMDWRMGAEWFESVLVDYEPTANWYNWTYRCLPAVKRSERPGERLRGLEILKWGTQHDPDAVYIKRWVQELASLPPTIAREPWRLGLNDNHAPTAPASGEGLRELAPGTKIKVNRQALAMLTSMGFDQGAAAIALYRTWEDPDAAAALLLSEKEAEDADEEDDLARAIRLSLGDAPHEGSSENPICVDDDSKQGQQSPFRYGESYPKPLIQPVSLQNTEEAEEEARREQARRDQQLASAKQRFMQKSSFSKPAWESARQQRDAETPTAARVSGKGQRGDNRRDDRSRSGKGQKGFEGKSTRVEDDDRSTTGGKVGGKGSGSGYNPRSEYSSESQYSREKEDHQKAADGAREKRGRWRAKEKVPDEVPDVVQGA